jgi:signal recognition particle subunit SEC65
MRHTNVVVYAVYIDSTLKRSGGRKISKDDGLPNPNPACMHRAVTALGFEATVDLERRHPRNFWVRGRLTVTFFTENHEPVDPAIPDRPALFKAIAAKVKELGNTAVVAAAAPKPAKLVGTEKSQAKRALAKKR